MKPVQYIGQIVEYFYNHPLWVGLVEWTKTHSLPGLKKIPIYHLIDFIIEETRKEDLVTRANSMAFSFFMAIFPGMIFLITLLPYLPYGPKFFDTLHQSILQLMPGQAGSWVFTTIEDLLKNQRPNLLSFGFLLTLWFASNGMLSMMSGMRKDHHQAFRAPNWWQERLTAIQLTFLVALSLFASVVFVILGQTIMDFALLYVKLDVLTRMALFLFRWAVVVVIFYSGITLVYRYGAPLRKRLPFFNSGATLATLLSILVSWGFSFYADNFGTYNTVYGSIGTILALLLWIQLNCMVLLIGFELNAGIVVIRDQNKRRKAEELAVVNDAQPPVHPRQNAE